MPAEDRNDGEQRGANGSNGANGHAKATSCLVAPQHFQAEGSLDTIAVEAIKIEPSGAWQAPDDARG